MKAITILSHMFAFHALIIGAYIGLMGVEELGGYLWQLLAVGCPFLVGVQVTTLFNSGE